VDARGAAGADGVVLLLLLLLLRTGEISAVLEHNAAAACGITLCTKSSSCT
jgi:hypothetical protein